MVFTPSVLKYEKNVAKDLRNNTVP